MQKFTKDNAELKGRHGLSWEGGKAAPNAVFFPCAGASMLLEDEMSW